MKPLSTTQQSVLDFLKSFVATNGYPPTRQEIASQFAWKSPNAAETHIQALAAKGCITVARGVSRGIKVIA